MMAAKTVSRGLRRSFSFKSTTLLSLHCQSRLLSIQNNIISSNNSPIPCQCQNYTKNNYIKTNKRQFWKFNSNKYPPYKSNNFHSFLLKDGNKHLSESALLAIEDYDNAINIQETSEAYSKRSFAYFYIKDYKQALKDAEKAIELNPRSIEGYVAASSIYIATKEHEKALEYLTNAIDLTSPIDFRRNAIEEVMRGLKLTIRTETVLANNQTQLPIQSQSQTQSQPQTQEQQQAQLPQSNINQTQNEIETETQTETLQQTENENISTKTAMDTINESIAESLSQTKPEQKDMFETIDRIDDSDTINNTNTINTNINTSSTANTNDNNNNNNNNNNESLKVQGEVVPDSKTMDEAAKKIVDVPFDDSKFMDLQKDITEKMVDIGGEAFQKKLMKLNEIPAVAKFQQKALRGEKPSYDDYRALMSDTRFQKYNEVMTEIAKNPKFSTVTAKFAKMDWNGAYQELKKDPEALKLYMKAFDALD